MSEPLDIQAVLQNGYFTTSRARPSHSPSPVRLTPPSSPRKPTSWRDEVRVPEPHQPHLCPPPPTVEEESDALEREYGTTSRDGPLAEEPKYRGDVDQHPLLIEVHEHNPERRFVLMPNSDELPPSIPKTEESDAEKRRPARPDGEGLNVPNGPRKHEPVIDDNPGKADPRPPIERRRSRQDLPPIDTGARHDQVPNHHRTRSAIGTRPDDFSGRSSTAARDDLLTPDCIKSGSSRREKAYHDYGIPTSTPRRLQHQRSYSYVADDRRHEKPRRRESVSPSHGSRSESTPDQRKPRRRLSNERTLDSRYREDGGMRTSRRESNVAYKRDPGPTPVTAAPKPMGPRPHKDETRAVDETGSHSRTTGRRRGNSTSIHQDLPPNSSPESKKVPRPEDRSRSRRGSVSKPATLSATVPPKDAPVHPRASATFPITTDEYQAAHLPYPEDIPTGRTERSAAHQSQAPQSASMPDIPLGSSAPSERSFDGGKATASSSSRSPAWPPKFEPGRDGLPAEHEIGSYRRFSEGRGEKGVPELPECPRKEPVPGKVDWLLLPHTDFNICPTCYQGTFADSEYRTQFHPMLRPADRAISCDFGSSTWYRIAWLLTLKNEHPDLRLLRQVDNVRKASRNQPCPGSRKALRNWLTIRDPYKRRAVPNFTVCYQCAKMVEALLPSLTGSFVPMDSRAEPLNSVCAMHFKPQRKRFALYFDTLETTADKAFRTNSAPDMVALAAKIERLSAVDECREDRPIPDTYWYTMQYLPELTVCADCFDTVVRPRLANDTVARNFYKNPQRMQLATCQLYSERMRDIFKKACRKNDPKYLQAKVLERRMVEADIQTQLVKLDRRGQDDAWTEDKVAKLIQEWKKWE